MSKYKPNINLEDPNNTITLIYKSVKNGSKVLDIGCASGYLAELLQKDKNCEVYGIEIDKEDAEKAEKFCKLVLRDNIEEESWEKSLFGVKFDHIIAADILEHLIDPESVLRRLKNFLTDDGTILISIPNIAHVSIRLELLEGNFIPEEVGILDDTHLKYFTKKTFVNIAQSAGYAVVRVVPSVFDFPKEFLTKKLKELGLTMSDKAMDVFSKEEAVAYQYFFELKSSDKSSKKLYEAEKPIYIIKDFLKTIEDDHRKFKKMEENNLKSLQNENKKLKKRAQELERELDNLNNYVTRKAEKKARVVLRKVKKRFFDIF